MPRGGKIGEALGYASNQWPTLVRYVQDGRLAIDNGAAEQAIRPLAVGRRNWLQIAGDGGLQTSVDDLALWDENFYTGTVGGKGFLARQLQQGVLNDGTVLPGHALAYDQASGFGLVQPLGRLQAPRLARGSAAGLRSPAPISRTHPVAASWSRRPFSHST